MCLCGGLCFFLGWVWVNFLGFVWVTFLGMVWITFGVGLGYFWGWTGVHFGGGRAYTRVSVWNVFGVVLRDFSVSF